MVRAGVGGRGLWQLSQVGVEFDLRRAQVNRADIGQVYLLVIVVMKILVLLGEVHHGLLDLDRLPLACLR